MIHIRASSLPGNADCPRRNAAKSFRGMVEKAGFELNSLLPSVGAAAGTATHKGVELMLRAKIDGKSETIKNAVDIAMAGFEEEVSEGCEWDDTTPNRDAAQSQIKRMVRAYPFDFIHPKEVELELEASSGDGFKLVGHMDVLTIEDWVRDTKTGALLRPYFHQLGAYSLLCRSNEIVKKLNGLAIDFIKRTPKTKPQEPVVSMEYPVMACEKAAWTMINRIKEDVQEFQSSGDPESFICNPMSMMCSEKYCPAWGTDFCELTKY